jgi:GxxExxY protein
MELIHRKITGPLIDLFFYIYRTLGFGFLERVYSNAMVVAGKNRGLDIQPHVPIHVHFDGAIIGRYQADLVINKCIIAELKTVSMLTVDHEAQLLNYLKATEYEVGFLFNFGPKAQYKRMVFDNKRKGNLTWLGSA